MVKQWVRRFVKWSRLICGYRQAAPRGADAWKLHREIIQFGSSNVGMPPLFVNEDPDGLLEIVDGVTRATRIAKLAPGATVPVIVIGHYQRSRAQSPRVGDRL